MAGLYWLVWLVGTPLTLWCVQELTPSALPVPLWLRAIPLLALVSQAVYGVSITSLPVSHWFLETLASTNIFVMCAGGIAGVTRAYVRSDALERRQMRWVVLGFWLTFLGMAVFNTTAGLVSEGPARLLTTAMTLALPVGFAVSVMAYDFLDVDRVISATASYTLIGLSVLGAALAGLPQAAVRVAATLGVPAEPARFVLSVTLLGLALLVHRALWPRLDRRFFRERHRREVGFAQLLDEIGRCTNLEELTRLPGERLDALLAPESIATYAREDALFTPVFVRGRTLPPAFEADSLLVRALEKRALPLAADGAALDPFDRAALETLGAAVLVPTRRGADLVAFSCLGCKRSGDIYTREELAWLAAVANRCSELLVKLSDEVVLREARALQQSLRRYVPGAVADAIASGGDLAPGAREVSVLFVDIRGYASFAERRRADEIFSTLNAYTERVSRFVTERGGSVVEFNGDGMMAVFGAPRALERKERAAVEAAREIVESLSPDISVGVGIATGEAFVGNIRATDRLIWSAIGNTTNLAARLQALTRELDAAIAIDATTRERAGYVCADFAHHAGVAIRGRTDRHDVFALPLARAVG
jgi:class 3 adenylate cyclase